jgi:hypothetical protein
MFDTPPACSALRLARKSRRIAHKIGERSLTGVGIAAAAAVLSCRPAAHLSASGSKAFHWRAVASSRASATRLSRHHESIFVCDFPIFIKEKSFSRALT